MLAAVASRLRPKLVLDSRLGLENVNAQQVAVARSGKAILTQEIPISNYSTQQITFSYYPSSLDSVTSKDIYLKLQLHFAVTTTAAGPSGNVLDFSLFDAIRSWPLHRIMSLLDIKVNGTSSSINPNFIIDALSWFSESDGFLRRDASMTATMPDFQQKYSDVYNNPRVAGVVMDPLQSFGNGGCTYGESRGSFPVFNVVGNAVGAGNPGTVTFDLILNESFIHPLLSAYNSCVPGLTNTRQIDFTINFVSDIFKSIWSHSDFANASANLTSVVTMPNSPSMGITQLQPSELQTIPRQVVYSYPQITIQSFNVGTVNALATNTFTFNSFQLPVWPKRIYVLVRQNDNNTTVTSTNTYGAITNLQFIFNGDPGLNASATQNQLWQQHRDAGGLQSWNMFTNMTGSICAVDITKVLMLKDVLAAPGALANSNIQVQCTFTNINSTQNINFVGWLIFLYDGLATIGDGAMVLQNNILTKDDILSVGNDVINADLSKEPHSWFGGGRKPKFVPYGKSRNEMMGSGFTSGNSSDPVPHKNVQDVDPRDFRGQGPVMKRGLFGGKAISKYDLQTRY